jgi:hypothetical protein
LSAESVILQGRVFTEAQMISTCVVRRVVRVWDESSGEYTEQNVDVYSGPCLFKFDTTVVREVDVQGQGLVEQQPLLKLPVTTSGDVRVDDIAVLTVNPLDPSWVGKRLRIAGVHGHTYATARRFPVEVVEGA